MKVVTLLCADGGRAPFVGDGETPAITPRLCSEPRQIESLAGEADRLVLGLHDGDFETHAVQTHARAAGIDALGLQIVDLAPIEHDERRLRTTLVGARARAAAFTESRAEHSKVTIPTQLSRRSMLTFWTPEYVAAPSIDEEVCAAGSGCRACVDICPRDALRWAGGRVFYDISVCEPCGRCLTTCPTGAVENPTVTAVMLEAQMRALAAQFGAPIGVAYVCGRGSSPQLPKTWFPVEVPCTGMATPPWILAPLLMGIGAAASLPCSRTGCSLRQDDVTRRHTDYAQSLLKELGIESGHLPEHPAADVPRPLPAARLEDPFGPHGGVEVLTALAAAVPNAGSVILDHEGSPVGVVSINEETCTGCTACVQSCPTSALEFLADGTTLTISFEPALCTACGQCVPRCPEIERGAITLDRRTDLAAVVGGRQTLYRQPTATCEICGRPIAPATMMNRLAELLGSEHTGTLDLISRRCLDCRGAW